MNREELIVKYSDNKVFLEDVGVSPEHAFRKDKLGDKSLLSVTSLPIKQTASYHRKKGEMCPDGLVKYFHKDEVKENRKAQKKRYHGKEFQKVFNKAECKNKLKDMSRHLKSEWRYQKQTMIRFVHDFIEKDDEEDDGDDSGDFKHHQIQIKVSLPPLGVNILPKEYLFFYFVKMGQNFKCQLKNWKEIALKISKKY